MMEGGLKEEKVALFPRLTIQTAPGPREYALVLTNQRSILVLEREVDSNKAFLLGGAIAATAAEARAMRRQIDYDKATPAELGSDPRNLTIPHRAIQNLQIKGGLAGVKVLFRFLTPTGERKIRAVVDAPPEFLKQRRKEGIKQRAAVREYGTTLHHSYQVVLPGDIAPRLRWRP